MSTPIHRPDPFFPPYMEESQPTQKPTKETSPCPHNESQNTVPAESSDRCVSLVIDSSNHKAFSDDEDNGDLESDSDNENVVNQTVLVPTTTQSNEKLNVSTSSKTHASQTPRQVVKTRVFSASYANTLKVKPSPVKSSHVKPKARRTSSYPDLSDRVLRSDSESGPEDMGSNVKFRKAFSVATKSTTK